MEFNHLQFNVLMALRQGTMETLGDIAKECASSLASINQVINDLLKDQMIEKTGAYQLTEKGNQLIQTYGVENAIILAAGFSSRFVPLSYECPKALLSVHGERMIERQIRQLHEVGIYQITLVVGYLKEKFDYLIDLFGVELVYCEDYAQRNNLSSLYCVRHKLSNSYVLSSDNYMVDNLFHAYEYDSWYCTVKAEAETEEWCVFTDHKNRIRRVELGGFQEWHMYGPVYFSKEFSEKIRPLLESAYHRPGTKNYYWEDVLCNHLDTLEIFANQQSRKVVYEFENLEELRVFDKTYQVNSKNETMKVIARVFNVEERQINGIVPLKLGMTNRSFLFEVCGESYICRIPGEGTDQLINRQEEYATYRALAPLQFTEVLVHFDPKTGIKIAKYEENTRALNTENVDELKAAMAMLKKLHTSDIQVDHSFDMGKSIRFYEKLCMDRHAILFEDYSKVRANMDLLLERLQSYPLVKTMAHIDANCDNFLVDDDLKMTLIDWEYAGMCDPLIDLSMFAIYSHFSKDQVEHLMQYYFHREPNEDERIRVYAYMALGGFLWSLWALYKQALGLSFGAYTLNMYRYAKAYYQEVIKL
ncbi:phosphotransferase [Gottschalkiaceae bacterium SANA]|nr:phosphotransferase [Gottschalkiaceae bacterium SANA]